MSIRTVIAALSGLTIAAGAWAQAEITIKAGGVYKDGSIESGVKCGSGAQGMPVYERGAARLHNVAFNQMCKE